MAIALTPVRGGSKSIPLKNIKNINSRPLVYWLIKALHESPSIDTIVVATDSDETSTTVAEFQIPNVEVYRRNTENTPDTASTESVILEYLSISQPG
jgi:CMP-N-acetylneuraminic acid synthetase